MLSLTTDQGQTTVARKLLEVGGHAWNGKIYDARGREIIFFAQIVSMGANPGRWMYEERRQRIDELRKDHAVIEVQHRHSERDNLYQ